MPNSDDPPDFEAALREIERLEKEIAIAVACGRFIAAARYALDASLLLNTFNRLRSAVSFDDSAVKALEMLPAVSAPHVRTLAVRASQKSGMSHLLLGDMDMAADRLQSAQCLVDDSVSPSVLADLHWDASVLAQWRHDPLDGLAHALLAWEYYKTHGKAVERSRLCVQIAQLAMDLAVASLHHSAYMSWDEYLQLAGRFLDKGRPRARARFAAEADLVYLLARIRFSRLTNVNENRLLLLSDAMWSASRLHDAPGQGQALMALGDELAALGRPDDARSAYVSAIDILSGSVAPGLARLPKRALLLDEEFRVK